MKAVDDWDPAFLDSLTDFEFDQSASGDMLYDLNQDPLGDYEKQVNDTMDTSLTGNSTSSSSSGTREPPARATFTLEDIQDNGGAVCFGWISHPGTKTWRRDVDDISRNQENNPIWTDDIATQVRKGLRLKGISEFFVPASGVNPIKRDIKRKSSSDDGSKDNENNDSNSKLWHSATNEEFMIRTRQRFNDARKNTNKPKRHRATQPKTNIRIPCYRINERSVCFEWNRHPGTAKWLEVVKQFSDNESCFPEWDDMISVWVKRKLEKASYGPFLVFTSVNDDPCTSIHHGLWVHATDKDIEEITRLHFLNNRGQLKEAPSGQINGPAGTPPSGGGPSGSPGSPKDSANFDCKPPGGDGSHQMGSLPHTFFGHGFGAGHHGRQRRLASVDTDCSDLTSSDHEGGNNASVKSSDATEESHNYAKEQVIEKRSTNLLSAFKMNVAAKNDSAGEKTVTANKIALVDMRAGTFTTTTSFPPMTITPTHTAAKRNTNYDWFYWLAPAFIGLALRTPIGPMYLIVALRVIVTRLILSTHYVFVDKDNYLNKLTQSQLQRERDDYQTAIVLHLWTQVMLQVIFPQMFFPTNGGNATLRQQSWEVFLLHVFLVEPLYYAVHRWLHAPAQMKSMHGFHHLSIQTLPTTSAVQNFQEHLIYVCTFGPAFFLPFLMHWSMHWQAIAGYLIAFDILNAWGHTNVRLSKSVLWNHPYSPLRYLFYIPEFHLGHHAYFSANYALFMPIWDHLFGTYREYVKPDQRRLKPSRQQDVVFIGHNAGWSHLLTCPEWNVYNAYHRYWYKLPLALEFLAMDMICQLTRLFFSFYYCSRFLVKDDKNEYIGRTIVLLRTPRDYACPNRYQSINQELVKLMRKQYDTCGTRYFGLGNLNKMKQLNDGGKVIEEMIQQDAYLHDKNIRIWTGDTMTAASVYHQIADIPKLDKLFYIGAGGKVGSAVCRKLVQTRPNMKIRIFSRSALLDHPNISYTSDLSELLDYKVVLVGKILKQKQYQKAFAAANKRSTPVATRFILDYTVPFIPIEAAVQYRTERIQHIQVGLLQTYPNNSFLKGHYDVCMSHDENQIYPCHFGCLINCVEQRETNEVGEIDLNEMEPQWDKALKRGFHNRDIEYF